MRTTIDALVITGFVFVDFLFFHDIFKAGEVISLPQYLTGVLSVVVIVRSGWSLLRSGHFYDDLPAPKRV